MRTSGKRIFLVFHGRFPSEKAASLFVAKSAEAFVSVGSDVVLLVPRRLARARQSETEFYGLQKHFKVVFLPVLDLFYVPLLRRVAFHVSFISFSLFVFLYLSMFAKKDDVIYSNEGFPLFFASFLFPNTVYEVHDFFSDKWYHRKILKRISRFVSTNRWKMKKMIERFDILAEKIIAEMNAVSLGDFSLSISSQESRRELQLPLNTTLVCYVGMLRTMGMGKGIEVALEAIRTLPDGITLVLVGGSPADVLYYNNEAHIAGIGDRVIFTGFVSHSLIPLYLSAADILIAPFPRTPHYELFMSPMKLFEYMASRRPIVASRLSSIEEIVKDGYSAVCVTPDSAESLKEGILLLKEDQEKGKVIARNAYEAVQEHTWGKRAQRILEFLK